MSIHNTIMLACLMATATFATQQIQDNLKYLGQEYKIGGNSNFPLEKYFESCSKEDEAKWFELRQVKNSDGKMTAVFSTGCYRGHVASWTIETNRLVLIAVKIKILSEEMESVAVLKPIFGENIKDGKLPAFWFTGHITLKGKNEILFFEKGKLIRKQAYNNNNDLCDTDRAMIVLDRETRKKAQQGGEEARR